MDAAGGALGSLDVYYTVVNLNEFRLCREQLSALGVTVTARPGICLDWSAEPTRDAVGCTVTGSIYERQVARVESLYLYAGADPEALAEKLVNFARSWLVILDDFPAAPPGENPAEGWCGLAAVAEDKDWVPWLRREYPETYAEFQRLLAEAFSLFARKQSNYGPHNIGVTTPRPRSDEEVRTALMGLWFRMNDKFQRLRNLVLDPHQQRADVGETLTDTYLDLAVYSLIALTVKGGKWGS